MWISTVLLSRHVPGRIFSGKHRAVIKVTKYQRKRTIENDQRIENNKELLSYPYLTVSEEHSHAAVRKHQERKKLFDMAKRNRNVTSSRTIGLLEHLNVAKT